MSFLEAEDAGGQVCYGERASATGGCWVMEGWRDVWWWKMVISPSMTVTNGDLSSSNCVFVNVKTPTFLVRWPFILSLAATVWGEHWMSEDVSRSLPSAFWRIWHSAVNERMRCAVLRLRRTPIASAGTKFLVRWRQKNKGEQQTALMSRDRIDLHRHHVKRREHNAKRWMIAASLHFGFCL